MRPGVAPAAGLLLAAFFVVPGSEASAAPGGQGEPHPPNERTLAPGNPCDSTGSTIYTGSGDCTLSVEGTTRSYRIHVPANYSPAKGVIFSFHGAGGSMHQEEKGSGLSVSADKYGFAVVYPDGLVLTTRGTGKSFNDRDLMRCGTPWRSKSGLDPDDIGFARQLIASLQPRLAFDPRRVFLHGQSAGAHFVHGLGVALSEMVAAIAPYAETLYSWHETPTIRCPNIPAPKTPVAVLILHGDADVWTKYEGMNKVNPDGTHTGTSNVDDSFEFWSKANRCRSVNTTKPLVTGIAGTPTSIDYKHAYDCEGSAEVKIYRLHRGIHFFYPYETRLDRSSDGPYNPNFGPTTGVTINDVIWNFFDAHPKAR